MKSFTDIEQSKELARILPLESADMWYQHTGISIKDGSQKPIYFPMVIRDCESDEDIPCWSLTALLENIPVYLITRENKTLRLRIDMGLDDFDIWYEESGLAVSELDCISKDFVDACVNMIIKLNKDRLL